MKKHSILIDLVGPSGSGKSTFVESALKYSRKFENIEMAAFRGLIHHPSINLPAKFILRLVPIRLAYRLRLTKLTDFYIEQIFRLNEMQSYSDFLKYVLDTINNLDDTTQADKHWLIRRVQSAVAQHLLINQAINADRIILADEFLLQKIFPIHALNLDFEKYLELLPTIKGVICFEAEADVIKKRIKKRASNRSRNLKKMSSFELDSLLQTSKQGTEIIYKKFDTKGIFATKMESPGDYQQAFQLLIKHFKTK